MARKNKVFSVSMVKSEVDDVDKYVEKLIKESGYKISRNEIIRRATLAHVKFMEDQNENKDYMEVFKGVGL